MNQKEYYRSKLDSFDVPHRETLSENFTVRNKHKTKTKRGWSGFDTLEVLKSVGIKNKLLFFSVMFLCGGFLFISYNPNVDNVFFRNEMMFYGCKIISGITAAITLASIFPGAKRIIITQSGFYYCYFWFKRFFPWSTCSKFNIREISFPSHDDLLIKNVQTCVEFRVENERISQEITLNGMSDHVLCVIMNQYREKYHNGN